MPTLPLNNRLHYAFVIAIVLHGVGILGIGYSTPKNHPAPSMEVTLARFETEQADSQADFYAQINQHGGGTELSKKLLSDTELSVLQNTPNSPSEQIKSTNNNETATNEQVFETKNETITVIISNNSNHDLFLKELSKPDYNVTESVQKNNINEQIVALKSQIAMRRQTLAKALKQRAITTLSTKSHQDAAYLEKWRKRIVSIGNIHYPKAASEQKMYGRVRLLIAMQANGNVNPSRYYNLLEKKFLTRGLLKSFVSLHLLHLFHRKCAKILMY